MIKTIKYQFQWPRAPVSQFCFLPHVVTLVWNGCQLPNFDKIFKTILAQ